MKLSIVHQEAYSRIELVVRFLFGSLYIVLPHSFLLFFIELWGTVLSFVAFWVVLFTGKYPRNMFEYQEKHLRWRLRVNARILNLCDGYPKFGLTAAEEDTNLEIPYPETLSRGLLLLRLFFGIFYVVIPHLFLLIFRILWGIILSFLAFWVVLFYGTYPKNWHQFWEQTIRWEYRVHIYMRFMTDTYPPFHGREFKETSGNA